MGGRNILYLPEKRGWQEYDTLLSFPGRQPVPVVVDGVCVGGWVGEYDVIIMIDCLVVLSLFRLTTNLAGKPC